MRFVASSNAERAQGLAPRPGDHDRAGHVVSTGTVSRPKHHAPLHLTGYGYENVGTLRVPGRSVLHWATANPGYFDIRFRVGGASAQTSWSARRITVRAATLSATN